MASDEIILPSVFQRRSSTPIFVSRMGLLWLGAQNSLRGVAIACLHIAVVQLIVRYLGAACFF